MLWTHPNEHVGDLCLERRGAGEEPHLIALGRGFGREGHVSPTDEHEAGDTPVVLDRIRRATGHAKTHVLRGDDQASRVEVSLTTQREVGEPIDRVEDVRLGDAPARRGTVRRTPRHVEPPRHESAAIAALREHVEREVVGRGVVGTVSRCEQPGSDDRRRDIATQLVAREAARRAGVAFAGDQPHERIDVPGADRGFDVP